jgi:AraC family transcriptional regulator
MYIRKRKLSLAANDIMFSDEKIIDIALKYGYESPTAFSRAFSQLFGVSPSSARNERVTLELYPKFNFNKLLFEESKVNAMENMEKYLTRGYHVSFLMPVYLTKSMDKTSEWFRDILGWFGCAIAHNDKGEGVYGCVYDYPGEIFHTINPQRGFYMFHGEPTQGTVGYMHAIGGLDNLYKFVKGNGWDKITEPADNHYGGRGCAITTIDGSILWFDEFPDKP